MNNIRQELKDLRNNNGAALIGSILLMVILVLLGQAMIYLSINEAKKEVRSRLSDAVFYVADAGIEKAIVNLQNENSNPFSGTIGGATGDAGGGYIVSIVSEGSNRYIIESTGYIPSTSSWKTRRKIEAIVDVTPSEPYIDGLAIRAGGNVTIAKDMTYKGGLWSNGDITLKDGTIIDDSSVGANDGNVYACGSVIFSGAYTDFDGGDPHVYANGAINNPANARDATFHANCTGTADELTPVPVGNFPAFDEDALLAGDNVIMHGPGRETINAAFDLANSVHVYPAGLDIGTSADFGTSSGTIIVTGDYPGSGSGNGIDIDKELGSAGNYITVNLCVTGENWTQDVNLKKTCYISGAIVGKANVDSDKDLHLNGVVDCGGEFTASKNMTIEYAQPEWSLSGGGAGGVTIISWNEEKIN